MADLTVQRTVPADPERVWRAFTTSELASWFWPPAWSTVAEIELDGEARYHLWSDVAGVGVNGEYLAVEPPRLIEQVWRWDDDGAETTVTITFEPDGPGTAITIVHAGFADDRTRDDHIQGWKDCLDRLPAALAARWPS